MKKFFKQKIINLFLKKSIKNYSRMRFLSKEKLESLFDAYKKIFNSNISDYKYLPESGSNRIYIRFFNKEQTIIAAYNPDYRENLAFLKINEQLKKAGVKVPEIFYSDIENGIFLLQDLGDTTLFTFCQENPDKIKDYYKRVIEDMPLIQIKAAENFDWNICYPRSAFDYQSIMWDLQYFKSYFLRLSGINFDEQFLENDFVTLANYLLQTKQDYFLYRDFQSRNIIIYNDNLYYIDYQGGRKGALQYDLASLLFEAKAKLPEDIRNELFEYYINVFSKYPNFDKNDFIKYFNAYILIRLLQALGAYGFRGYFEGKSYFIKSIAPALKLLDWFISNVNIGVEIKFLLNYLEKILNSEFAQNVFKFSHENNKFTLRLYSFSYRKGIPYDFSGNGGGFVFDCRFLPNPGRLEEFKKFTGKDDKVIEFFKDKDLLKKFLENVEKIIEDAIQEYINNDYKELMVCFGCTGGQHRSVYCVEEIAKRIKNKFDINVELLHRELN